MANILPLDELNALEARLPEHFEDGKIRSEKDAEDIIDELLDLFLLAYASGAEDTKESLNSGVEVRFEDAMETINREIAGETWEQRVWHYYETGGTLEDIVRIARTEAHRDANEAAYRTAKAAGATQKVWHCMMLPTSRDTHVYLDGVTAPIDGEFYSYKGGSTLFPGQWGIADEDCNCQCICTYR